MNWLRTTLREVWGLFVEDGVFAVAIVSWLGLIWLLAWLQFAPTRLGWLLFGGLAMILVESALRHARKQAHKMRE